ncbi:translocation/assembly module TamB domain-containing protein [Bacteroidota bacterium]
MGKRSLFKLMFWGSYRRPILKAALLILFIILWFMISISAALQVPRIQTSVTQYIAAYLTEITGTPITVRKVNINWFSHFTLYDLEILDETGHNLITSEKVKINFMVHTFRREKKTRFKKAVFENTTIRVFRNKKDSDFNITYLADNWRKLQKQDTLDSISSLLEIGDFELVNSTFIFADPFKDSLSGRFNYNQFRLNNIYAIAENFRVHNKTFSIDIGKMSFIDSKSGFNVNDLSGTYTYEPTSMTFQNFDFKTGASHVNASVALNYDSVAQLKNLVDEVTIVAEIRSSDIHSRDLAHFAPGVNKYSQRFKIKGLFQGEISSFSVKNMELGLGQNSRLKGVVYFDGLPDFENSFIDIKVEDSYVDPTDFSDYFKEELNDRLAMFGSTEFSGRFTGFPIDFVADGLFLSNIGRIDTDINLKVDPNPDLSSYSGNLIVTDLDLGILLKNKKLFQQLDMRGNVTGKGLSFESADFDLKADIDTLGIFGYNYKNIKTDGRFTREIFNGLLSIEDPNLTLSADAAINLADNSQSIEVFATLDTAILHNMNLSKKESGLSFNIDINMKGLNIDEMTGQIEAEDAFMFFDGDAMEIKDFKLISSNIDSSRTIHVSTEDFTFDAAGRFDYSVLIKDLPRVYKEYLLLIKNDHDSLSQYFVEATVPEYSDYFLDYELHLNDINKILELFIPDLYLSPKSLLKGHLAGGRESVIKLTSHIDTIRYKSMFLLNTDYQINTRHLYDTTVVHADVLARIDKQIPENGKGVENLYLRGNWNNKKIDFEINAEQSASDSKADIFGVISLFTDTTEIRIKPSILKLFGDRWSIPQNNRIWLSNKEIDFENVRFYFDEQSIQLNGIISQNPDKDLTILINDLQMENFNLIIPRNIYGKLDGFIKIQDYYNETFINSNLGIDEFVFVKFPVGDINISSKWEDDKKRMNIQMAVVGKEGDRNIDLNGFYYPARENNKLDLIAEFDNANLNVIEPFYADLISNLRGFTKGEFHIGGNFRNPILQGEGLVKDGTVKLDYLNTDYTFEGEVLFTENEIGFRNIQLMDEYKNTGELNGGIFHTGFKNIRFDLKGEFEKLMTLNTSSRNNDLYYGTAFGSGTIDITGRGKNINLKINAKTDAGTKLFIPLSGTAEAGQEEYIQFVDPEETILQAEIKDHFNLSGVRLDFDLEVTPEAYCEIIFDIQAGDIIRGSGNGKLNLQIDTKGDFLMFGDFEIAKGGYNFTLYNLINKEFVIQPNSLITWSGDPYGANMDLVATYKQNASLTPLIPDTTVHSNPDIRRKYPTDVILYLKGPLMSPEIDFDIDITDYPRNLVVSGVSLETTVSAFEATIHADEQELKRQVFSLIILRKFSEMGAFSVSGYSFGSSVSEFISNQLSYWITQFDENLEVEVDLGALDQNAFNTFQLRLSYTFMDGRLRVTRAGDVNTTGENSSDLSNIVGDWTVEYLLTQDGKYRVRMYNRFNYNSVNTLTYNKSTTTTAGFSLMHTQSVDELKDLFRRSRDKSKQRQKSEYIQYEEGVVPSGKKDEEKKDEGVIITGDIEE